MVPYLENIPSFIIEQLRLIIQVLFSDFPIFIKKNIYKTNLSKEGTLTCRLIRRGLADHFQVAVHVSELVHLLRQRARGFKGKPETCNSKTKYQLIHRNKLIKKKKRKKLLNRLECSLVLADFYKDFYIFYTT